FRTQKLSPPAPMVLLTRESRSPPVFIFEKPLHVNAEAFSFGTGTNITSNHYNTKNERLWKLRSL
ncbi:hypothetical protein KRE48_07740, partial [Elizabethkingia meningoseptica]